MRCFPAFINEFQEQRLIYFLDNTLYLHLSKLMIDPTPAVADNGVVYSSCFRRRTNHQSMVNIANATIFIPAHNPTYLQTKTRFCHKFHFACNKN